MEYEVRAEIAIYVEAESKEEAEKKVTEDIGMIDTMFLCDIDSEVSTRNE